MRTSSTPNATRFWQADQIGTEPLKTWTYGIFEKVSYGGRGLMNASAMIAGRELV